MTLVTCPDGVVRVVYQGELTASKYLRAALPLPAPALHGNVSITILRQRGKRCLHWTSRRAVDRPDLDDGRRLSISQRVIGFGDHWHSVVNIGD